MCICTAILDNTDFIIPRDPMFYQLCKQDKSSMAERRMGKYAKMVSIEWLMILMILFHIIQASIFSFAYNHRFDRKCKCIDSSVVALAVSFAIADVCCLIFTFVMTNN